VCGCSRGAEDVRKEMTQNDTLCDGAERVCWGPRVMRQLPCARSGCRTCITLGVNVKCKETKGPM